MNDLKERTKQFALRVIRLVESLPHTKTTEVIARQLLRSATSVGANYRSACRARSGAEFRAKLGIVEEDADESAYWSELLVDSSAIAPHLVAPLLQEADEPLAIVISSIKTSRQHARKTPRS